MFRTIHRLLKFFGFGGLRHILIPEAAHVSGHIKARGVALKLALKNA